MKIQPGSLRRETSGQKLMSFGVRHIISLSWEWLVNYIPACSVKSVINHRNSSLGFLVSRPQIIYVGLWCILLSHATRCPISASLCTMYFWSVWCDVNVTVEVVAVTHCPKKSGWTEPGVCLHVAILFRKFMLKRLLHSMLLYQFQCRLGACRVIVSNYLKIISTLCICTQISNCISHEQ